MIAYGYVLAFVAGLFLIAGLLRFAVVVIDEMSHRLRGDVRCTGPDCSCRGTVRG